MDSESEGETLASLIREPQSSGDMGSEPLEATELTIAPAVLNIAFDNEDFSFEGETVEPGFSEEVAGTSEEVWGLETLDDTVQHLEALKGADDEDLNELEKVFGDDDLFDEGEEDEKARITRVKKTERERAKVLEVRLVWIRS